VSGNVDVILPSSDLLAGYKPQTTFLADTKIRKTKKSKKNRKNRKNEKNKKNRKNKNKKNKSG
jgi:hypothetical protein